VLNATASLQVFDAWWWLWVTAAVTASKVTLTADCAGWCILSPNPNIMPVAYIMLSVSVWFVGISQGHQQTSASLVMDALSPSEADAVCQLASDSTPAAAASFNDDACIAVL